MNKRMLTSILSVFVLALLFVASPALAADVDVNANNTETGADSDNDNITKLENDGDVDIDNTADVDNKAHAHANTGKNDENMNTTGGDINSGDVDASTDWETVVNEGYGLCGCASGDHDSYSVDFDNDTTGYDSDNKNLLKVEDDGKLDIDNIADIWNRLGLRANTGKNDMNMNTTGGDIDSGSVGVVAGIKNVANVASGSGSHGDGTSVDVDASNEMTGAESDNDNIVDIDNSGDTFIDNVAVIDNKVRVKANTGYNDSNKNTTGGETHTGDIDVVTDIHNEVNSGDCCYAGGKDVDVDADFSNKKTGYDSDNKNKLEIDNSGKVDIDNTAVVNNELHVDANSGGNDSNKNTTGGDTKTGNVSINFSSSTTANSAE